MNKSYKKMMRKEMATIDLQKQSMVMAKSLEEEMSIFTSGSNSKRLREKHQNQHLKSEIKEGYKIKI